MISIHLSCVNGKPREMSVDECWVSRQYIGGSQELDHSEIFNYALASCLQTPLRVHLVDFIVYSGTIPLAKIATSSCSSQASLKHLEGMARLCMEVMHARLNRN